MAHLFICPNCGPRRPRPTASRLPQPTPGCSKCGFGFLFELLDDYYPAPNAAFFVCDQNGPHHRLRPRLARAHRPFRREGDGPRGARGTRACDFEDGADHVGTVLEWGVRQLGKPVVVNAEGDLPAKAVADLFPAYDDDGGLLLVLTPSK